MGKNEIHKTGEIFVPTKYINMHLNLHKESHHTQFGKTISFLAKTISVNSITCGITGDKQENEASITLSGRTYDKKFQFVGQSPKF